MCKTHRTLCMTEQRNNLQWQLFAVKSCIKRPDRCLQICNSFSSSLTHSLFSSLHYNYSVLIVKDKICLSIRTELCPCPTINQCNTGRNIGIKIEKLVTNLLHISTKQLCWKLRLKAVAYCGWIFIHWQVFVVSRLCCNWWAELNTVRCGLLFPFRRSSFCFPIVCMWMGFSVDGLTSTYTPLFI